MRRRILNSRLDLTGKEANMGEIWSVFLVPVSTLATTIEGFLGRF